MPKLREFIFGFFVYVSLFGLIGSLSIVSALCYESGNCNDKLPIYSSGSCISAAGKNVCYYKGTDTNKLFDSINGSRGGQCSACDFECNMRSVHCARCYTSCDYNYLPSNPYGTPTYSGTDYPSNLSVSSDVPSENPATPNVYQINPARKYIEFTWRPPRMPKTRAYSSNMQDIYFNGSANFGLPTDKSFPNNHPNRFRVAFDTLSCGTYTVGVGATLVTTDWANCSARCLHWCSNSRGYYMSNIVTFTKDCCDASPTLNSPSPGDGWVYPASQSSISLGWRLNSPCSSTYVDYQTLSLKKPDGTVSPTRSITPITGVSNTPYSYNLAAVTEITPYRCKNLPATGWYEWTVKAKNRGTAPEAVMGPLKFQIAPNYAEITGHEFVAGCFITGSSVTIPNIVVYDTNLINNDNYEFRIASGSRQYTTTMNQTSCTTVDSTHFKCSPRFTVTAPGTYTLSARLLNTCGTINIPYKAGVTPVSFIVEDTVSGSLVLEDSTSLDSNYFLNLSASGYLPGTNLRMEYAFNSSISMDCSSTSLSWNPVSQFGIPNTCTVQSSGICRSRVFSLPNAGYYCFRVSTTTPGSCSYLSTAGPAQIYLVNVYLRKDTTDSLGCAPSTPPTAGQPLNNELITVTYTTGSDVYSRHTGPSNDTAAGVTDSDPTGVTRFSLNVPPVGTNVVVHTDCGGGGCTLDPDDPYYRCREIFLACAGTVIPPGSGSFAPVPGSYGNINYSTPAIPVAPGEYSVYMRVGTVPSPKEWLSTVQGDVYSHGINMSWCSENKSEGLFDGSLLERPENHPTNYAKGGTTAGRPFTGGYLFSQYNSSTGAIIESLNDPDPQNVVYYLSEPNPIGRYALDLPSDPEDYFGDRQFEQWKELAMDNGGGFILPEGTVAFPATGNLGNGGVFVSNNLHNYIATRSTYRLNAGRLAVVYYTGNNDIVFSQAGGFTNTAGGSSTLILMIPTDVSISRNIGYSCSWNSALNTGSCGSIPGQDYGPSRTPYTPNIDALIVTLGNVFIEDPPVTYVGGDIDMNASISVIKVLKMKGGIVSWQDEDDPIEFGRLMGRLSAKYPGETVVYDPNILYRVTNLERTTGRPVSGITRIKPKIYYGY